MPAPAVIPALVAYINTVVVKTLVVDRRTVGLNSVSAHSVVVPCYNGAAWRVVDILGVCPHKLCLWGVRYGFLPIVRSLPMVRYW